MGMAKKLRVGSVSKFRLTASLSFLPIEDENPPQCSMCAVLLTVEHLLVTCLALKKTRLQFFNDPLLHSVFSNAAPRHIFAFIKAFIGLVEECEMYNCLCVISTISSQVN
jgi:hypothetical protein